MPGEDHPGVRMSLAQWIPKEHVLRRFAYAVAAVLALAPLAVITPASAAVQRPATTQNFTVCDNHPEVDVENPYIGWWNANHTEVLDSSGIYITPFCKLPEGTANGYSWYAFRKYGTSDCATYDASNNTVQMEGCDPSSNEQQKWGLSAGAWMFTQTTYLQHGIKFNLAGNGGDTPLYMGDNLDQAWSWPCVQNC
jgi:hypothetical protein